MAFTSHVDFGLPRTTIRCKRISWSGGNQHRDRVNAKAMKDPRLAKMMDPKAMPFDGKRMIYGGFKAVVDA